MLPEDDLAAWKVLLSWMMPREHPEHEVLTGPNLLGVRCWVLGDKYNIPEFLDKAMLALLVSVVDNAMATEVYREVADHSPPASPSRALVAEDAIEQRSNG